MDFVLKRKGGVPLHDQLLAQLELRILSGVLAPGQRLPSVRALARRLGLHANTVSSAYRALEAAGHVELRRGAGVYVRAGSPAALEDARGLDEMIRLALSAAFRKGHSGGEIRAAVERWLRAAPPERVVIVDPRRETLELIAHEIRTTIGVPASGCTLEELEREPGLAAGALLVALPYHVSKVLRAAPGTPVETIRVEGSDEDQKAVLSVPAGGTILLVSASPIVLQIAQGVIGGLRGDELLVEARLVTRRADWRRLLPAADLVIADTLSAGMVREARPRRLRELRLLGSADLATVRKALHRAEPAA
jgi:DNA-binding transcriptional regulator YhcF (GntR family)